MTDNDKTTRRQITLDERDLLVDMNLKKAAGEMGIDDDAGLTLEKWIAATEHVNRAAGLMREPAPRLKTTTKAKTTDDG